MGAAFIGNIITDRTSSPPEAAPHYTEHLIYMPNAYLVNSLRESFPDIVHPRYRLFPFVFILCVCVCVSPDIRITALQTRTAWRRSRSGGEGGPGCCGGWEKCSGVGG